MILSDEELVEQMSAGDESALKELYDRHARQVLGLLIRFVPQRVDAEDLLQVTFLEAWRKAKNYHPSRGRPIVWLCLIARSRALDWLRRKPAIEPLSEFAGIANKETVASVEQQESSERIQEALARLPREQSTVISLSFFDGLTHEQISVQQGVPLGTVKTRIRQGMSRLGHLLRKQGLETFT
jgi:RNA polymerase sigma-70 factor (ECF subfamily)